MSTAATFASLAAVQAKLDKSMAATAARIAAIEARIAKVR